MPLPSIVPDHDGCWQHRCSPWSFWLAFFWCCALPTCSSAAGGILLNTGGATDNSNLVETFDTLTTRLTEMSFATKYHLLPMDIYYYLCKQPFWWPVGIIGSSSYRNTNDVKRLCAPFYGETTRDGRNYDFTHILINHFHLLLPDRKSQMTPWHIRWIQSNIKKIGGVFEEDTDNSFVVCTMIQEDLTQSTQQSVFCYFGRKMESKRLLWFPKKNLSFFTQWLFPILAVLFLLHSSLIWKCLLAQVQQVDDKKEAGKTFLVHLKKCMESKDFAIKVPLQNFLEHFFLAVQRNEGEH